MVSNENDGRRGGKGGKRRPQVTIDLEATSKRDAAPGTSPDVVEGQGQEPIVEQGLPPAAAQVSRAETSAEAAGAQARATPATTPDLPGKEPIPTEVANDTEASNQPAAQLAQENLMARENTPVIGALADKSFSEQAVPLEAAEPAQTRERIGVGTGRSNAMALIAAGLIGGAVGVTGSYMIALNGSWPGLTAVETQRAQIVELERKLAAAAPANLDRLQARLEQTEAKLGSFVDPAAFAALSKAFDDQRSRLQALAGEQSGLRQRTTDATERVGKAANDQINTLNARLAEIENKVLGDLATFRGTLSQRLDQERDERAATISKVGSELQSSLALVSARLDALEKSVEAGAGALTASVSEQAARLGEARKSLDALTARLTGYEDFGKTVDVLFARVATFDDLRRNINIANQQLAVLDQLKTIVNGNRASLEAVVGKLEAMAGKVEGVDALAVAVKVASLKAASFDARVNEIDANARKALDTRTDAVFALSLAGLKAAVDSGRPFSGELSTVKATGREPGALTLLEARAAQGIPNEAALIAAFKTAASKMLQAAAPPPADGVFNKLLASAGGSVSVRRVGDTAGEGPDAILARVEARLAGRDLAGALDAWRELPEPARAVSASWASDVEARVAADKSISTVTANAIARLAESGQ